MQQADKIKIEKLISKIESASFDENDIDNLFLKIRQYCGESAIIREIADFVAHPDIRDKGITRDALQGFYLSLKYFDEFVQSGKILDFSKPFPSYIHKLIKSQLKKCNKDEFKASTGLSGSKFIELLDKAIQIDQQSETCFFKMKPDQRVYTAIKHVLSFISGKPAFTSDEIIDQLIVALRNIGLKFDETKIREQARRIIVCVLLLIHNTTYNYKGYKSGKCRISCEKPSIVLIPTGSNAPVIKSILNESHGNLRIDGEITFLFRNNDVRASFTVLDTTLNAIEWCNKDMITAKPVGSTALIQEVIDFDAELRLDEKFILTKI